MPFLSIAGEPTMGLLRKAARAASMSTSLIAFAVFAPCAHAQGEQKHVYHLPAQSLVASLRAVALASGRTIGVPPKLVANRLAPALDGEYSAEAAVAALLAGTSLHLHAIGNGLIINADASVEQPPNADGGVDAAADGPEILVTGSRIRGAPIASPVIVLDRQAMEESGRTNLGDVMRSLPQSFGGGQNPGIAASVPAASGINVGGASTANLRGLGSDATLTLLDGHRLTYNGSRQGVDLTSLPFGMIDRVEVVADGASALYGSDAVAGVVNVILKRDYEGFRSARTSAGQLTTEIFSSSTMW
jgi:outer membrane receptor protein involved in Fe transport